MNGTGWSSRSLGSRFKHEIFYRLIRHLGPWAAYPLLYAVVFYYSLMPKVVKRSRPYLRRRFPEAGFFQKWRHAFRLNLSFGLVLLERAVMGLKGRMNFQDPAGGGLIIKELLAEGRGLLIVTAHVGAWQTGLGWLPETGAPVNIVQRRQEADVDLHYFEHRAGTEMPRLIDPGEPVAALAAMTSALLAGEIVCVMGDRIFGDRLQTTVSFLGDEIQLPGSPFYLAARVGAPMAVVLTRRVGRSRVAGQIVRVIRAADRPEHYGKTGSLTTTATIFAECLEDYVKQYPYQFFNFYDLWSKDD